MLGRKLTGARAICENLQWNERKFYRRLDELKRAGVVMYDYEGRPPRRVLVSYEGLLARYIIVWAQAQYVDEMEEKKRKQQG